MVINIYKLKNSYINNLKQKINNFITKFFLIKSNAVTNFTQKHLGPFLLF